MIKPFKFLQGRPTRLYHYNRAVNTDLYTAYRMGQDVPPFNLSRRHWNMLPQDLRGATLQEIECYILGWENARSLISTCPYDDRTRGVLWTRGFWDCLDRTSTAPRNFDISRPEVRIFNFAVGIYDTRIILYYYGDSDDMSIHALIEEIVNDLTNHTDVTRNNMNDMEIVLRAHLNGEIRIN